MLELAGRGWNRMEEAGIGGNILKLARIGWIRSEKAGIGLNRQGTLWDRLKWLE